VATDVRLDDDRLAAVLASVGEHLVVDVSVVDVSVLEGSGQRQATAGRAVWRPLLIAAAVIAVIAGAVLAIAPARRAVGGWFGAGRIDVEFDRTAAPAGLPAFTDAAERIEPDTAARLLGRPMPPVDRSSLGAPNGWWTVPEGGVVVGWPGGDTSLWVVSVEGDGGDLVKKVATGSNVVSELPNLGDGGIAVSGDHVLQTPHRRVRATSVVVWTDGDLMLRLDGTRPPAELIAIATQLAR
jgi:hypothetical protein